MNEGCVKVINFLVIYGCTPNGGVDAISNLAITVSSYFLDFVKNHEQVLILPTAYDLI
jgi:hypothetical protein